MQNAGLANYSSFLVWKGYRLWMSFAKVVEAERWPRCMIVWVVGRGDRCCLEKKIRDFEWQAREISPMVFDFGVALWMADRMGGWPWWGQLLGPRCTLSSVDIAPPPPPPRSSPPPPPSPSGFNVFLTLRPNIQVIHQGQVRPHTGRDGRNNKLSWSRWHLPTKRLQTCVKNTS